MSDLISRQELIEDDGWIPCSKWMPKDGEEVLITFEYYRYGEYNRMFKKIGIGFTIDGRWSHIVNGTTGWRKLRILAWQPLPKIYEEGGAE